MSCIEKEVIKALDDNLMGFIIKDTIEFASNYEKQIIEKKYDVFSKFDKLMCLMENIFELYYTYIDYTRKVPECDIDVAELLGKLFDLLKTIRKCDYKFDEYDELDEPKIIDDLNDFLMRLLSYDFKERSYYLTINDIETYRQNMLEKIRKNKK